jgi:hypothetical protein
MPALIDNPTKAVNRFGLVYTCGSEDDVPSPICAGKKVPKFLTGPPKGTDNGWTALMAFVCQATELLAIMVLDYAMSWSDVWRSGRG